MSAKGHTHVLRVAGQGPDLIHTTQTAQGGRVGTMQMVAPAQHFLSTAQHVRASWQQVPQMGSPEQQS